MNCWQPDLRLKRANLWASADRSRSRELRSRTLDGERSNAARFCGLGHCARSCRTRRGSIHCRDGPLSPDFVNSLGTLRRDSMLRRPCEPAHAAFRRPGPLSRRASPLGHVGGGSNSPLALISAVGGNTNPTAADISIDHPTKFDKGASVLTPIKSNATAMRVGRTMIPIADDATQRSTNERRDKGGTTLRMMVIYQSQYGRPRCGFSGAHSGNPADGKTINGG